MTETSSGDALSAVKVLDLTQYEAAPIITQALAWYGAQVVKIEPPGKGEQSRFAASDIQGVETFHFLLLNCNKLSVTVNLRDERGKELLRRMIPKADIFIENFAPGTIERLGFSYEQVTEINPRIIYAQVKGYSSGSQFSRYLAFDMTMQAMGGSMSVTGTTETPPLRPGPTLGDTGAGMHCLVGILAALNQRQRTGRGQHVEVSMQECVANFCRTAFADQQVLGRAAPRVGNLDPLGRLAPSNVYACKPFGMNDYCYVGCSDEIQWERLARTMGREDLLSDPRFNSREARLAHLGELDQAIGEWSRNHTKLDAASILGRAGVPAGPVLDTRELADDAYLRERGTFAGIEHWVRGELVVPGWPVKMSRSRVGVVRPPRLGEYTDQVLQEWLMLGREQLAQLREQKVI